MPPLAAAAPDFTQHDVDLGVGFDDLFVMLMVFTGVCLAVLVAFAAGALFITNPERGDEQRASRPRTTAAPGLLRNPVGAPEAGDSVRRSTSPAPAASSALGHYTVPLPRSVARTLASPIPAGPPVRSFHTVPLPRFVVEALKAHTTHGSAVSRQTRPIGRR